VAVPLQLPEQGTLSLWYFVDDYLSPQTIIDNSAGADSWRLSIGSDGVLQFQIADQTGLVSTDLDRLGGAHQWYHFAVTWNRADTTESAVQLLVNGSLVASNSMDAWSAPGETFFLGGGLGQNPSGSGVWDDLRIHSQPLDVSAIQAMLQQSVFPAPLVAVSSEAEDKAYRPALRITQVAGLPGDLNGDDLLDVTDIDLLTAGIRAGDPRADLNRDGSADFQDLSYMIESLLHTSFGDANLDGRFDSDDLLQVFKRDEYEDTIPSNSTWADGDWNGDGESTSDDLVLAFQSGRYNAGVPPLNARAVAAAVDWLFAEDQNTTRQQKMRP
jgi:hypothetical protein